MLGNNSRVPIIWILLLSGFNVWCSPQVNLYNKTPSDVEHVATTLPKNTTNAVLHFLEDYRRLRAKKNEETMRTIATVGLVSGALRVEELIRENLRKLTDDLVGKFNTSTPKENMDKLLALEEVMERDKSSIEVLISALEFARNIKTYENFNEDMRLILKENKASMEQLHNKRRAAVQTLSNESAPIGNLMERSQKSQQYELMEKVNDVREMIDRHRNQIHSNVTKNARETIAFLHQLQKQNAAIDAHKRKHKVEPARGTNSLAGLLEVWKLIRAPQTSVSIDQNDLNNNDFDDDDDNEEITRRRRQDAGNKSNEEKEKKSKENEISGELHAEELQNDEDGEGSESGSSEESEGGLVGLIANLSGGDEGSDVGALIGALTGVITNLLGPSGIDVPSTIGSASSLLAGLLAGDENFGKVLGNYVGLAIDGFSGGGGAINNGQFFGQFLGRVLSYLSADPDDEDLPPKPDIFIYNAFNGSARGLAKDDAPDQAGASSDDNQQHKSDSAAFITHIVTTLVGVLTNAIASASLGSSGGSSHGVAGLFGGSSHSSSKS